MDLQKKRKEGMADRRSCRPLHQAFTSVIYLDAPLFRVSDVMATKCALPSACVV